MVVPEKSSKEEERNLGERKVDDQEHRGIEPLASYPFKGGSEKRNRR